MSREDATSVRRAARDIAIRLIEAGFETFFAGGCVRDRLLGIDAVDVDIATSATPEQVKVIFPRARGVGAHFGVMLVPMGKQLIEVATFRTDGVYHDGRRPESVTFGSAEADARRRDFSINGLFEDPVSGEVIDHVGGLEDLERGVVRAIGDPDARFEEDRLRILRAVRFAARFDFKIDPDTFAAMVARVDRLGAVSTERIGHELRRMLTDPSWRVATALLEEAGLDRAVLGRERSSGGPTTDPLHDADIEWVDRLARWEIDRGHTDPSELDGRLTRALVLSNLERQTLLDVAEIRERVLSSWPSLGVAARKRLAAHPSFPRSIRILRAEASEVVSEVLADVEGLRATGLAPVPLLSGDDLIELGFVPGPNLGQVLHELYDRQLEGELSSRDDAMDAARLLQNSDQ